MHRDRDFDMQRELPPQERDVSRDLELETLLREMSGDDVFLLDVCRRALLLGRRGDVDAILYRQQILQDCLRNRAAVRELYDIAIEAIETRKTHHIWGFATRYPGGILRGSIEVLEALIGPLKKLRTFADAKATVFQSGGFINLLSALRRELSDGYFAEIAKHLAELRLDYGVLASAQLGEGNEGIQYTLREERDKRPRWLKRILGTALPGFTFHIAERDEAGAKALSELRDTSINLVANALAQSTDHILNFFQMLRTELAFYAGSINLHEKLEAIGAPMCTPRPQPLGSGALRFRALYDVSLASPWGKQSSETRSMRTASDS